MSLQKCILAEGGKKKIPHFIFPVSDILLPIPQEQSRHFFKPNDTVAGCSLQPGGLHSEFIPLPVLCHAISTGSPFGEVFSDPAHAPSILGAYIHRFPSGGSFYSHCRGTVQGFISPLQMP